MLGAGVQGTSAALALAHAGWSVTLIDRSDALFRGASLRGEGKLHLGYVYANDPTRRTAVSMVDAATSFAPLLDRWMSKPIDWEAARSSCFNYAALRDSMVASERLLEHYAWVDDLIAERLDEGGSYAGRRSLQRVRVLDDHRLHGYTDLVETLVGTDEVALDPRVVRSAMLDGLQAGGVELVRSTTVTGVDRRADSFRVCGRRAERDECFEADVVVNCLWDGRLEIDRSVGIEPTRPWTYRLKYGVHGRAKTGVTPPPTTTFVLGPFGDIVRRSDDQIYLSWYPDCLAGFSTDATIPDDWRVSMGGDDPADRQDDIAERTIEAIGTLAPSVGDVEASTAAAGVIVAWGETDIDDHDSGLHRRSDIGVHAHDGYFSIDTGKLTSAPRHAADLLELVQR
ncbi:FAD-dependent oxidoreductase [Ilumatobacter fluminis]|uniref:FAD-dependent oxidoreductase n=1 Tax=Ilumatobacter fluminis TaxID=467091 RepID=UPI001414EFBF|nr:FAD-dependent oxidoreductase [Ilumatobacter fluminis]